MKPSATLECTKIYHDINPSCKKIKDVPERFTCDTDYIKTETTSAIQSDDIDKCEAFKGRISQTAGFPPDTSGEEYCLYQTKGDIEKFSFCGSGCLVIGSNAVIADIFHKCCKRNTNSIQGDI